MTDATTQNELTPTQTLLIKMVRTHVQASGRDIDSGYRLLKEGDAWRQAVDMPARMADVKVSREDMEVALRHCGWRRDTRPGYWRK